MVNATSMKRANNKKKKTKFFGKKHLLVLAVFAALGALLVYRSLAATPTLSSYYPNTARYKKTQPTGKVGYYLEGFNYAGANAPSRSVLWFEDQGNGWFKQYNSAPYDRCHWDLLGWANSILTYTKTYDGCNQQNNEVVYSPGVQFMPRTIPTSNQWSIKGSSSTAFYNYKRNATTPVCTGTNDWTSTLIGWETIAPGVQGLHIQNNQTITWKTGSDPTGCAAGYSTKWVEHFYLIKRLPIEGTAGTGFALKRQVGGNVDSFNKTGKWDYDVWFDSWNKLP